jgi:hypothetical protein
MGQGFDVGDKDDGYDASSDDGMHFKSNTVVLTLIDIFIYMQNNNESQHQSSNLF